MSEYLRSVNVVAVIAYAALLVIALIPIWAVRYHVTQDGPAHVYSAKVMLGLLRGDPVYSNIYRFNPAPVPNATGHWLTALMLLVVDQFTAAKLIASVSFASVAGAVAWMWRRFADGGRLITGLLYGFVVAFNWMWLEGFYNFTIGVAGYALGLTLFAKWERMNLLRMGILAALALVVYFSHELCFVALAISVVVVALVRQTNERWRTLGLAALAFMPAVALLAIYTYMTSGSAPPVNVDLAPANGWFTQIRTANPFMIVLTRNLPFSDTSSYAPIFAPALWIVGALVLLALGRQTDGQTVKAPRMRLAFVCLCVLFISGALFAPESLAGGSIIRPRMTLLASIALVPFISGPIRRPFRIAATGVLALVFVFQSTALWDYSLTTSADAEEILAWMGTVADGEGISAITVAPAAPRYPTAPLRHIDGFMSGAGSGVALGVYEFALPSFPVIARSESDRELISSLDYDSYVVGPTQDKSHDAERLAHDFDTAHERISTVTLWNADDNVRRALDRWYEPAATSSSGRAQVFRRLP